MGFLTFLKNFFQRAPKKSTEDEAYSLVQFPPTVYPQPQPLPALSSRTIQASAVTQIHRHEPPPTVLPTITVIPPSPVTIPHGERFKREEPVSSQVAYPPELRRQVDDEVVDTMDSEGLECDTPSESAPPYTPFASRPFNAADLVHTPQRGVVTSCPAGHNVQSQAFTPVHPPTLYHLSYMPYPEADHHTYLHSPPSRSSRNPQRREQANQSHSHEASGRHSRNTPAYSRHPMQTPA